MSRLDASGSSYQLTINHKITQDDPVYKWEQIIQAHCTHVEGIWAFNPALKSRNMPSQGWKLHISATSFNCVEVASIVFPVLLEENLYFKTINSFHDIYKLNTGMHYGYSQIGKVITVYLFKSELADQIARRLAMLLLGFEAPSVPSDYQYIDDSPVYFRYGSFDSSIVINVDGEDLSAIVRPDGKLVHDTRKREDAIPDFETNPFRSLAKRHRHSPSPFSQDLIVFETIMQRGKGGVFKGIDLQDRTPRLCIVKEGRKNGEYQAPDFSGKNLIDNEYHVLNYLRLHGLPVPKTLRHFCVAGNSYLIAEYIESITLVDYLKRSLSYRDRLYIAICTTRFIKAMHEISVAWRDCKPSNILVSPNGDISFIDFEGALFFDGTFHSPLWGSPGYFSKEIQTSGFQTICQYSDIYSLAVVLYQVFSGLDNPALLSRSEWPGYHDGVDSHLGRMILKCLDVDVLLESDPLNILNQIHTRLCSEFCNTIQSPEDNLGKLWATGV